MTEIIVINDIEANKDLFSETDYKNINSDHPDRVIVVRQLGRIIAKCSIWLNPICKYHHYDLALIGHFFAESLSLAQLVLTEALELIKRYGRNYVIGPINGSTWKNYRFVLEGNGEPPFFLEPINPQFYVQAFVNLNLKPIEHYNSSITNNTLPNGDRMEHISCRLNQANITIQPFDRNNIPVELEQIYNLTTKSFKNNILFSKISLKEFINLYMPLITHIDTNFFITAKHYNKIIGFIFCYLDIDSLVIKTLAIEQSRHYAGLGSFLIYKIHVMAAQLRISHVIHALMHDNNLSKSASNKYNGTIFRKYALFGKTL